MILSTIKGEKKERLVTWISPAPHRISYGRKLFVGQRKVLHSAVDLCQLSFEVADLNEQFVDSFLELLLASILARRSRFSALICGAEQIDVAFVLATDQIEQIFVIEAFALASLDTSHFVVVQVDVDWCASGVVE
jgi:hypothetical protein